MQVLRRTEAEMTNKLDDGYVAGDKKHGIPISPTLALEAEERKARRIAELEAENVELRARIMELEGRR